MSFTTSATVCRQDCGQGEGDGQEDQRGEEEASPGEESGCWREEVLRGRDSRVICGVLTLCCQVSYNKKTFQT